MKGVVLDVPADLLTRYATAAPRYTSYPTAVDWVTDIPPDGYRQHLRRSAEAGGPCSVYVHVPFCESLCLYCGCNVVITHDHGRATSYLDLLEKEIHEVHAAAGTRRPMTQYHWGGGTPTFLSEAEIERLHTAILGAFTIAPDAEVAIEVDPRVTTERQLALLGRLGFNRLSLGIQDFDPKVQEAVRRIQSFELTKAVVDAGRAHGFRSVNVDLIYGLPYQSLDAFLHSIDRVLELRPERVALFHYAHVPWMKKHQTALDLEATPSSDLKMSIFTHAIAAFTGAGYDYLGLDHFALPDDEMAVARRQGTLKRNFMGYSTRAGVDAIGLGVSAIGEVAGAYFQNSHILKEWSQGILENRLATGKNHLLTADDRLRRQVIMDLMCHGSVSKAEIAAAHGVADFDTHFAPELAALAPLAKDGLVELRPDALVVTRLGQVFLRNVAVVFDRYFQARHASPGGPARTFSRTL